MYVESRVAVYYSESDDEMLHSPSTHGNADSEEEILLPSANDDNSTSHGFTAATHHEGFTSLSLFRLCVAGFLFSLSFISEHQRKN